MEHLNSFYRSDFPARVFSVWRVGPVGRHFLQVIFQNTLVLPHDHFNARDILCFLCDVITQGTVCHVMKETSNKKSRKNVMKKQHLVILSNIIRYN